MRKHKKEIEIQIDTNHVAIHHAPAQKHISKQFRYICTKKQKKKIAKKKVFSNGRAKTIFVYSFTFIIVYAFVHKIICNPFAHTHTS